MRLSLVAIAFALGACSACGEPSTDIRRLPVLHAVTLESPFRGVAAWVEADDESRALLIAGTDGSLRRVGAGTATLEATADEILPASALRTQGVAVVRRQGVPSDDLLVHQAREASGEETVSRHALWWIPFDGAPVLVADLQLRAPIAGRGAVTLTSIHDGTLLAAWSETEPESQERLFLIRRDWLEAHRTSPCREIACLPTAGATETILTGLDVAVAVTSATEATVFAGALDVADPHAARWHLVSQRCSPTACESPIELTDIPRLDSGAASAVLWGGEPLYAQAGDVTHAIRVISAGRARSLAATAPGPVLSPAAISAGEDEVRFAVATTAGPDATLEIEIYEVSSDTPVRLPGRIVVDVGEPYYGSVVVRRAPDRMLLLAQPVAGNRITLHELDLGAE